MVLSGATAMTVLPCKWQRREFMTWPMQAKSHIFNNMMIYQGRRGQHHLLVQYHVQYIFSIYITEVHTYV